MVPILRYQTLAQVTLWTWVQSNFHNDPPSSFAREDYTVFCLLRSGGTNYMSTEMARILLRIKNRYEVDISLRLPW